MKNPFKIGEQVVTKVGGKEAEAIVTKLWQNEVQVRTADDELRWRNVYTVWYPDSSPLKRSEGTAKSMGVAIAGTTKTVAATTASRNSPRSKSKVSGKRSKKRG